MMEVTIGTMSRYSDTIDTIAIVFTPVTFITAVFLVLNCP